MASLSTVQAVVVPLPDPASIGRVDSVADWAHRATGLVLLLALSPLLLLIALAVWVTDGAPLLFAHYRVGRDGRLFRCMKFRTMRVDAQERLAHLLSTDPAARAEWERDHKLTRDPRVTPIGSFLRRTSLDELPQLLNEVRGEMVLVGPRPVTVEELTRYGRARWHYLSVAPGITGLWQVSGRNTTTYEQRVNLDRLYVENQSLLLDLKILALTLGVVVSRKGAY
jgi:lipopolysaccharide/colanic/teichoic acid biosynthesis glycosyltransferase